MKTVTTTVCEVDWTEPEPKHLHGIRGNECAKRAVEVALSGPHEIVFLSFVRSPASDLLRAAARIAKENGLRFKGSVVPVCPCGAYGSPRIECNCSMADLQRHARKALPMLKAVPIIVETAEPRATETAGRNEPEERIVARILAARKKPPAKACLTADAEELLSLAIEEMGTDRDKAMAVAATIARMDGRAGIATSDVAEAIQYQHPSTARRVDDFEEAEA